MEDRGGVERWRVTDAHRVRSAGRALRCRHELGLTAMARTVAPEGLTDVLQTDRHLRHGPRHNSNMDQHTLDMDLQTHL